MDQITRQDAAEMKQVVQPKTKLEACDLTLRDAIAVPGLPTLSIKTVNSYPDMFRRFWGWAERHGRAPHKLFDGMKVAKAKQAAEKRKAYSKEQLSRLYAELTENCSGLVKKDDHKWGTLLAIFTGRGCGKWRNWCRLTFGVKAVSGTSTSMRMVRRKASSRLPPSVGCPSIRS